MQQILQIGQTFNSLLGFYQYKAQMLMQLNQYWQQQMESEWHLHSRVANFQEGILTVEVDSPVWANRLRYVSVDLLPRLQAVPALSKLITIKWYVKPKENIHSMTKLSKKPAAISAQTKILLQSTADILPEGALKSALQGLARVEVSSKL